MSKIFYSDVIGSRRADITASGANDAVPVFAVATVTENVALNHVFEMFALPPGYSVHSLEVAAEDVMTVSVGVMPGLVRDKVFANRTTSNLIGVEIRDPAALVANTFAPTTKLAGSLIPAVQAEHRSIGVQVTAAPGATVGPGRRIFVTALLRPQYNGV